MPEGDLEHYLYKMRDEQQVAHYDPPLWRTIEWSMAVARALAFLHKFPVIHRDLKPLNLLLTKTLEIKVTDFGTSKLMAKAARDSEDATGHVLESRYKECTDTKRTQHNATNCQNAKGKFVVSKSKYIPLGIHFEPQHQTLVFIKNTGLDMFQLQHQTVLEGKTAWVSNRFRF